MKKRHALFLFGEYRTFETVSKFYDVPDNVDVFISTNDYSSEKRKCWLQKNYNTQEWEVHCVPDFPIHDPDSYEYGKNPKSNLIYEQKISMKDFEGHRFNPVYVNLRPYKELNQSNTDNMIYHWKHLINYVYERPEKYWNNYTNIYMWRMDAVTLTSGQTNNHSPLTKSEVLELKEDTLYSAQGDDRMEGWTFANDTLWFGRKEVMKSFIDYVPQDINKRKEKFGMAGPHKSLAKAVMELQNMNVLVHKTCSSILSSLFQRRGKVDYLEDGYENWVLKNKHRSENPIFNQKHSWRKYLNHC